MQPIVAGLQCKIGGATDKVSDIIPFAAGRRRRADKSGKLRKGEMRMRAYRLPVWVLSNEMRIRTSKEKLTKIYDAREEMRLFRDGNIL